MKDIQIQTLDLYFQKLPKTIASYLIAGPEGLILVETGPASTLPNLRAQLANYGCQISDIKHVLVTHIHLDHAGAAGWLAREGAQIYVHQVGAPHLIDPSRLLQSAARIYGDEMDSLWGETVAAPAYKVTAVQNREIIDVAGLRFVAIDSPGHAWHHHTYRLNDIAFTGDAAGIHLPGSNLVDLPAPPPEFKLEIWDKTIDRLLAEKFSAIYPTHFGRVDQPKKQLENLRMLMHEAVEFVRQRMDDGQSRDDIVDSYVTWMQERARTSGLSDFAIQQYAAANPLYMSVDGIMRYWRRKQDKERSK
jgi:glyoxylase-like metal-dependent hydrolase (beta-lactamase superfamily II)